MLRRVLISMAFTAALLSFATCQQGAYLDIDGAALQAASETTITKDGLEMPHGGGHIAIPLSTNVDVTVQIPEDAGWISDMGSTKGSGTVSLNLYISPNAGSEERYAEIILAGRDAGVAKRFYVRQSGHIPTLVLTVEATEFTLPGLEGTDVSANVSWGDGTPDEAYRSGLSHEYATAGPHTVTITGRYITGFTASETTGITAVDATGL